MSIKFDPNRPMIIVDGSIHGPTGHVRLKFAVDPGATTTVLAVGFDPAQFRSGPSLVTAGGVVSTWAATPRYVRALGWQRDDFPILTYVFPPGLAVDGLLGLDFLRNHILTIDLHRGEIEPSPEPSASVTP